MKIVGTQELEERISEMLRLVQETGETVAVVKDGEIIAQLVPPGIPQWLAKIPSGDVWANLEHVRAEIDAHWEGNTSAVDAVHDVRREL